MTYRRIEEMVGGWIVGNFEPTCVKSEACEVACKQYDAGALEPAHEHRIATEITLIVSGRAVMNGRTLSAGDIVVIQPGEASDFRTLEATTTVVVKLPSVPGDKYPVAERGAAS